MEKNFNIEISLKNISIYSYLQLPKVYNRLEKIKKHTPVISNY